LHVILPLAISFFAFEFIHYLSDVYKGDKPIKNPLEFALFAAFFPSQIAGPIKRYQDFVEKLRKKPTFEPAMFNAGIALILQGLFKKVALADNLAILANTGFQNYASLGTFESWLAVLAFTFQIYFDFSGYTDMGRGSAMLLGIELPINFNLPYIASSVTDFWKRWHISLSTWLRDYLYIPLGGNRCSKARRQINLMVTMLLGGLWHGAAWHFVAWGMLHGAALIINHKYASIVETSKALQKAHQSLPARLTCIIVTFLFVVITWVFFRADTIAQASSILANMFSYSQSHVLAECLRSSLLPYALSTYLVYAIIFTPSTVSRPEWLNSITRSIFARPTLRIPCYVAAYFAAIGLSAPQVSAFIYFQF
ncbi:MAG: hypothetical protein K8F91_10255, partial [Candidatus Obscuribacterales bacterium]|nr:hypothetical protein [Candidatus Obscuribacterales bacterium]